MTTPFGPQLIGETEKTLNAILRRALDGTGLTEPQWVTLRLAGQVDADEDALTVALADRARFDDATALIAQLTARGLLEGGRWSSAGRDLVEFVQARIAQLAAPVWHDLGDADVAAAERVLNEITRRARAVLA